MQTVKSVKVTTLADNVVYDKRLLGQFGFSAFLEVRTHDGKKHFIIFDTGLKKGGLLYNVEALKLDLSPVEFIVLSHGHNDHTSATVELLRKSKQRVKVVAHPYAFLPRFIVKKGKREHHGIPPKERRKDMEEAGAQVIEATRPTEIIPGVTTSGEIERVNMFEKFRWKAKTVINGKQVKDRILDDQALFINLKGKGLLVLYGCAHAGLINTIEHALKVTEEKRVYGFIGGTHLVGSKEDRLNETIKKLAEYDLKLVSPAHCTAHKSIVRLNQAFPKAFVVNYAGRVIDTAKRVKNPVF